MDFNMVCGEQSQRIQSAPKIILFNTGTFNITKLLWKKPYNKERLKSTWKLILKKSSFSNSDNLEKKVWL